MKILLDANIFLWMFLLPSRISADVEKLLKDLNNDIYLSAASAWEIAIKFGINKLQLPDAPEIYVTQRMKRANLRPLEITHKHTLAIAGLPQIHKDPFDRLLIAQANVENFSILSADKIFLRYNVKFIDSETYKI